MGNPNAEDNETYLSFQSSKSSHLVHQGSLDNRSDKTGHHILQNGQLESPVKEPEDPENVQEFNTKGSELKRGEEGRKIDEELALIVQGLTIKENGHFVHTPTPKPVLYYGWFLGHTSSDSLRKVAQDYFLECDEVDQFHRWVQETRGRGREAQRRVLPGRRCSWLICRERGRSRGQGLFYTYERTRNNLLHVTAKFCGSVSYEAYSHEAQSSIGSEFNLKIVGLFFTKRTCGFRVKLTNEQENLFDFKRDLGMGRSTPHCSSPREDETLEVKASKPQPLNQKETKSSDDDEVKSSSSKYPSLMFLEQEENFQPTISRAHITIGVAPMVRPKETGDDLLYIIDLEQRPSTDFQDHRVPSGILRQFGTERDYTFVLYPKTSIVAKGVFLPAF